MKSENVSLIPIERGKSATARFANAFIESVHKMGLFEMKLLLVLSRMIQTRGQTKILIPYSTVMAALSMKGDAYKKIEKAVIGLCSNCIVIKEVGENGQRKFKAYPFLAEGGYEGTGEITIELSPKMSLFLFDLKKNYTDVVIASAARFRSKYTMRVYQLLKQYLSAGTRKFDVFELRGMLDCVDKPSQFGAFKRDVLETSKREINTYSDIEVDYTFEMSGQGGKVSSILYVIKLNPNFNPDAAYGGHPIIPGFEPENLQVAEFELELRKSGVTGPIKPMVTASGGIEAALWYWKSILKPDIDRSRGINNRNAYIRSKFKTDCLSSWNNYKISKKFSSALVPLDEKGKNERGEEYLRRQEFFFSLEENERKRKVENNLLNAPDDFFKSYLIENILPHIDDLTEDEYLTWIDPLFLEQVK